MSKWNSVAEKYNALVGDTGDIYHRTYINPVILELLGSVKGEKILDLACGQGYFSRILAKRGAKVTGIDKSEKLLKIAKARVNEKSTDIEFYHSDSAKLNGLKNASFDIVVANMSFHNIKNIKGTIKECSRVLKTNGRIIFSIPHPWHNIAERKKRKGGWYLKVTGYKSLSSEKHFIKGLDTDMYHRPIDFYFHELFKNKFVISSFFEIATKHHRGKIITDPGLKKHKKEIPSFLIVEGIKSYTAGVN